MTARRSGALLTLLALGACTGAAVERFEDPRLAALRQTGYRVAVMPFAVSAPAEGFLASSLAPVGELFALEGGAGLPDRSMLGAVLRGDVVTWLQQGPFDVVEPWVTDTQLAHAGLDHAAMVDPARAADVAALLQVDGVLYGDVTRWNRSYYVVQSTAEVGLRLELRDAGTAAVLFSTTRAESIGSGVTGGPTGFVSAATEPVAGLRGSHLRDLTRSVARNAAIDLGGGTLGNDPSPLAPRLSFVAVARRHPGAFAVGERVDVVAVGTAGCEVRFDLGSLRTGVPMPAAGAFDDARGDRATYTGHYVVQAGDPVITVPLFCTIRRPGERGQPSRYRWDGLVELRSGALR
ncbi:MAG: GNA1162 family protein [Planctomycetota bacterium]